MVGPSEKNRKGQPGIRKGLIFFSVVPSFPWHLNNLIQVYLWGNFVPFFSCYLMFFCLVSILPTVNGNHRWMEPDPKLYKLKLSLKQVN